MEAVIVGLVVGLVVAAFYHIELRYQREIAKMDRDYAKFCAQEAIRCVDSEYPETAKIWLSSIIKNVDRR